MTNEHLEQRFLELNPSQPAALKEQCWINIYNHYRESQRHYHTLKHLCDLFVQLDHVSHMVKNIPVVEMAIFYHDIIYNPGKSDNEERSALIAEKELHKLNWRERDIREISAFIRSTRAHVADAAVLNIDDLHLFLDMDLSILGSDWDTYRAYSQNILKEFGNNLIVRMGRKNFMNKFLEKPRIYHTSFFQNKLEAKARENIQREIKALLKW